MGFRYRKSINLGGGFKINMSKSGIGYSWGVPGYRITKTARGNTRKTYSIPGTGLSYVDETGRTRTTPSPQPTYTNENSMMQDIDSAPIEQLKSAEYSEFVEQLQKILTINKVSNVFLWFTLLIAVPPFFIFPIIGVVLKIMLHTIWKLDLDYTVEEDILSEYNKKTEAWLSLNQCNKLWQITQFMNVTDRKRNAGAGRTINRIPLKILAKTPFYITSNIKTVQMKLKKETIILLPDRILIIKGRKAGTVGYATVNIDVSNTRFIEESGVPKDAQIVDYTWKYLNKNGTPDRRFNDNRQLPICLYGCITIQSSEGLNIEIHCSNDQVAHAFNDTIN